MRARVSALLVLAACAVRTPIGDLQPEGSTTMQGSSGEASSTDEIPTTGSSTSTTATSQATTSAGPGTTTVDDGMTAEATSLDTSVGGTTDPTASGSDTDPTAGSTTG